MNFIKKKLKSHKKDDEEEEYEKAVYEQSLHPQNSDQKMKTGEEWQFFQQLSMKVQDTVQKTQTTLNKLKDIHQDEDGEDVNTYDGDGELLPKDIPPYGKVLRAPPRPPPPSGEKAMTSDLDFGSDFNHSSPSKGPPRPPPPISSDPFTMDSSAFHGSSSKSFGSPARPPPPSTSKAETTTISASFPVTSDTSFVGTNAGKDNYSLLDEFGFKSDTVTSTVPANVQDLLFLDDKIVDDPFDTSFVDVSNLTSVSKNNGMESKASEKSYNPFSSSTVSDDWLSNSSSIDTNKKTVTNPFFSGGSDVKSDAGTENSQSGSSHNPFALDKSAVTNQAQDDLFGLDISSSTKDDLTDLFQTSDDSSKAEFGNNKGFLNAAFSIESNNKIDIDLNEKSVFAPDTSISSVTHRTSIPSDSKDIWSIENKADTSDILSADISNKGNSADAAKSLDSSIIWDTEPLSSTDVLFPEKSVIGESSSSSEKVEEHIEVKTEAIDILGSISVVSNEQVLNSESPVSSSSKNDEILQPSRKASNAVPESESEVKNNADFNTDTISSYADGNRKDQNADVESAKILNLSENVEKENIEDDISHNSDNFAAPQDTDSYSVSQVTDSYSVSQVTDSYSVSHVTDSYSVSQVTDSYSVSQVTDGYSISQVTDSYSDSQVTNSYSASQVTDTYSASQVTDSYSASQVTDTYSASQVGDSYSASQIIDSYSTSEVTDSFSTPQTGDNCLTPQVSDSFSVAQVSDSGPDSQVRDSFSFALETESFSTAQKDESFSKPFDEENENAFVFKVQSKNDIDFDAFAAKFENAKDNLGSEAFDPFMGKKAPMLKKIQDHKGFDSMDEFDPFKVVSRPEECKLKKDPSRDSFEDYDTEVDFSVVIKPKVKDSSDVKLSTMEPPKLLPPPKTPTKAFDTPASRFNPFDKDFLDNNAEISKAIEKPFSLVEVEEEAVPALGEAGVRKSESVETPLSPLFDEDTSQPLEVFPKPFDKEGWDMVLRQPNKKKLTGNRFWKKIFVKLSENSVLQLFNKSDDKLPFQELPLQACYSLSEVGAQQYDQYGKIFTVKLQYKFYRERVGVRPGQISKVTQGQVTTMGDVAKLGLPLQHSPQTSQLLKLGTQSYADIKSFILEIEDVLFRMTVHRDRVLTYKTEEVQVVAQDEFYVEQSKTGHVDKQLARVRIFFLAFITGMPSVEVGLNDINRQGKEVVGRYDIIPVVTEEWIRLEDCEFHSCVEQDEFHKNKTIKFTPPDACLFELLRYRIRPPKNRELPLQVRVFMTVTNSRVEIRSDILVPGYSSRKQGQVPCENIQIRFPVPECWIYLFRTEKHFRYGSKKSTARRPGKIKGLERIIGAAQNLDPSLIEVSAGQAKYEHVFHAVVWRIPRLPKEGQGAYTQQLFLLRTELTSFDQIPETFEQYVDVEFTMPATYVSHTTVRSVSVTNPIPPEKYVKYVSKHEYKVEIDFKYSSDEIDGLISASNVNVPVTTTSAVQESTEDEEKDEDSD